MKRRMWVGNENNAPACVPRRGMESSASEALPAVSLLEDNIAEEFKVHWHTTGICLNTMRIYTYCLQRRGVCL